LSGGSDGTEAGTPTTFLRTITITNNAATSLPVGYTIGVTFPAADMQSDIDAGKLRSDLGDLRLRGPSGEPDRIIDAPPLASVVWFSLTAAIDAGATDTTYALTYGQPDAGAAPANGAVVFSFYDDFAGPALDPQWLTVGDIVPHGGTITLAQGQSEAVTTAMPQNPQTMLEISAAVTNPASNDGTSDTDYGYWLGFQHNGNFDASAPWILWLSSDVETIGSYETANGCSNGCNGPNIPQTTAFRVYGIERPPTQTIFYVDGAMSFTTNANNNQSLSIMIRNFLVASDIVVDWVRSHTVIYPTPTVTLGPEQTE
jgi:hypothetical protein